MKLADGSKVETMTSPSTDAPPPFNERTAMFGVKQTVYRTDDGTTYSELFQLKPPATSLKSATLRHCSKHDLKYASPARLSATTVVQPAAMACTSSRVAHYDSPYCAWCFENTATVQNYGQTMPSVHRPRSPPTVARCRSGEVDVVSEIFRHRCHQPPSTTGRFGRSDVEGNRNDEDEWMDTLLAGQPALDRLLSTPVNYQVPMADVDAAVDGDDFSETSPDIVISTAAQQQQQFDVNEA
jgi:hypothetical protein